jgi:hypothetical protein
MRVLADGNEVARTIKDVRSNVRRAGFRRPWDTTRHYVPISARTAHASYRMAYAQALPTTVRFRVGRSGRMST